MSLAERNSSTKPVRALNWLALLLSGIALLAALWIVCPAPHYFVWLLSVATSEWSLWVALLGVSGIALSFAARAAGGSQRLWRTALLCGTLAVAFALVPPASALRAARRHHVQLSLVEYASGLWESAPENLTEQPAIITRTFATVDGQELRLDVFLPPAHVTSNGGGIIVVHGGSWNAGARSDFPQWNHWLARQGYAVFDIDYRLAPQPNWQTATGDVKCAVLWVKAHAAEFHVNPQRLALIGRSAGGQLSLLAAYTTASELEFPPSCAEIAGDVEPAAANKLDTSVGAVIAFYAPTDLLWAYDHPANQFVIDGPATLRNFLGGNPHETPGMRERFRLASPIAHVSNSTPPTLLIHGGHDQLVRSENMPLLAGRLSAAGVPHKKVLIPYAQHGFDYNFHGWGAQIVKPVLLSFLCESFNRR